jgi:hypothetical protein
MGQARTPLNRKAHNKPINKELPQGKVVVLQKRKAEAAEVIEDDHVSHKKAKTNGAMSPPRSDLLEWRRKMKKAIKSQVFYFDVDSKQAAELTQAVTDLGAVSLLLLLCLFSHALTQDRRELLLENCHSRRQLENYRRRQERQTESSNLCQDIA